MEKWSTKDIKGSVKKAGDFVNKIPFKNILVILLLILIPITLGFMARVQPMQLKVTGQWAEQTINANLKAQFSQEISKQYPYLPDEQKQKLIDDEVSKFIADQPAQYDTALKQLTTQFKGEFQNPDGHLYLTGIDEYYYVRKAANVLRTGYIFDEIRNGLWWDNHMIAPLGTEMAFNLHPYIIAYWHRFMSIFGFKDLIQTSFFIPILFSCLAVIPAFFIARRFGGNIAGLIAGVLIAITPPIISRTTGGVVDTDLYNVFLPLMATWLYIEAVYAKKAISRCILAVLGGITIAVYSLIWHWWYIFDLLLITMAGVFVYNAVKYFITNEPRENRNFFKKLSINIWPALILVLTTFAFIGLFRGPGEVFTLISKPISYYLLKAPHASLFPNVMTTVAEQTAASVQNIIGSIGGDGFMFVALIGLFLITFNLNKMAKRDYIFLAGGLVWYSILAFILHPQGIITYCLLIAIPLLIRYVELMINKKADIRVELSMLLSAWFVIGFFASVKGIRFSLLYATPFALLAGIGFGMLYKRLKPAISHAIHLSETIVAVLLIIGMGLILIPQIKDGFGSSDQLPLFNDAWNNALTKIKLDSAPNAIISSWWDYGHWFKYVADRAVTFDGASQNYPMAHWIGRVLLTPNEREAAGLLRMLDCGSNNAFETINAELNNTPRTVELIYRVVLKSKENAREYLENESISNATITKTLEYTHCEPPEAYFITSSDMIGKSGVWAHFGAWDFVKSEMYHDVTSTTSDNAIELLMTKYNLSSDDATQSYSDIQSKSADDFVAPWPVYIDTADCSALSLEKLECQHTVEGENVNFIINRTTKKVYLETIDGLAFPKSIVTYSEAGYSELHFPNSQIGISVDLIQTGNETFSTILLNQELALSTFTKLYFYGGQGMKCFELFDRTTQIDGGDIYVWKVNWGCLK
jgi:asparagine N-glycosylation enzyme membrane subunit Stt3